MCGTCRYVRSKDDSKFLSDFTKEEFSRNPYPIPFDDSFRESLKETDRISDGEGDYLGFIHFEQRDKLIPLSVDVSFSGVSGRPGAGELIGNRRMSLRASILFPHIPPDSEGGTPVDYSIPFFLEGIPFSSQTGQLVSGAGGEVFQILHQTKELIYGVVYNTNYGRVGRFLVTKKFAKEKEKVYAFVKSTTLEGDFHFVSTDEQYEPSRQIRVRAGEPLSTGASHALFPFIVNGTLKLSIDGAGPEGRPIESLDYTARSTYDIYTGVGELIFIDNMRLFGFYNGEKWAFVQKVGDMFSVSDTYLKALEFKRLEH